MKKSFIAFALLPLCLLLSQANSNQPFPTTQIGLNLYKIEVDVNSIIASVGLDGVLLCDVGGESKGPRVMATVRKLGSKKIDYIIDTHWHVDHTGGNICFGKEALIIAHENVRKRLAKDKYLEFWDEEHPAFPEYALPDLVFSDRMMLHFNGEDIEIIHLPAGHTDGDAVVYFRNANVLHAGDCLFSNGFPAIDFETGGSVEGFADNLNQIASMMPSDVRIIVGHGPDYTVKELKAYETMVRSSLRAVRDAMQKGLSVEAMQEAHLLDDWKEYGKGFFSCDEWIDMIAQSLIHQSNLDSKTSKQQPGLNGPYLGQTPPGMTPEIFAPGIITTCYHEHSSPAFSPDGKEVYWSVFFNFYGPQVIVMMTSENGLWKAPKVAPFSGQYTDGNPVLTRDGKKLYFESQRPVREDSDYTGDLDLWVVKRNINGWGEPEHLGGIINSTQWERGPSVSDDGNLYFASWREGGFGASDIYRSRFVNGRFLEPENLGGTINTDGYENWPFIAPDESYLLFESNEGNVCISFRGKDNTWTAPISMVKELGTFRSQDRFPLLSFDGRYLFFVSSRRIGKPFFEKRLSLSEIKKRAITIGNGFGDVYWVDAKIIEELRPKE